MNKEEGTMEQITLTKDELIRIVEREVSKRLDVKKPISSSAIFNKVRIEHDDIEKINKDYEFTSHLSVGRMEKINHPVPLKKYACGFGRVHRKAYTQDVHDHIRKLTLSMYGVTLNSDLSEVEYSQAAETYNALKEFYLHLYKKRLSKLSLGDFE